MKAKAGDMIVVKGHTLGEPDRTGEIVEVGGEDGAPPYFVRWGDVDDHVHFFFPGPDSQVRHPGHREAGGKPA